MTPQQAYEKRYAAIDGGQHTWDAAPPHVKEMWLAAWTIAWAMAESGEREACAMWADSVARDIDETNSTNIEIKYAASYIAKGIRARGQE